jgi:hypothetical protein
MVTNISEVSATSIFRVEEYSTLKVVGKHLQDYKPPYAEGGNTVAAVRTTDLTRFFVMQNRKSVFWGTCIFLGTLFSNEWNILAVPRGQTT